MKKLFAILVTLGLPSISLASGFSNITENYPSLFSFTSTTGSFTGTGFTFDGGTSTTVTITGGSGQSTTQIFVIEDDAGTDVFKVDQYGYAVFDKGASVMQHTSTFTLRDASGGSEGMVINAYGSTISEGGINFGNVFTFSRTSGAQKLVAFGGAFEPTSGTTTFETARISTTVNQTGGASGIARGVYVKPTLTAAADWRDIEVTGTGTYSIVVSGAAPIQLPVQEADTVTSPVTCNAANHGVLQVVDDTNDSATSVLCVCLNTDDSTYDFMRVDDNATACPEY